MRRWEANDLALAASRQARGVQAEWGVPVASGGLNTQLLGISLAISQGFSHFQLQRGCEALRMGNGRQSKYRLVVCDAT